MKNSKFSEILSIFFTLIIITIIIGFIINKQYRFIYNAVFIYIAYVGIVHYEKKDVISVTNSIKCLIVFVATMHLVFGQYLGLYKNSMYFDKGLHLVGTFMISLLLYKVLMSLFEEQLNSRFIVFILISSIGITSGVFLEILEFTLDTIFNTSNQHGLVDINFDLIFNVIGASFAGFIVAIKY